MRIMCAKCERKMSGSEFIAYFEAWALKLFEKVIAQFLVQAAENYLLTETRGFFDNQMATLANSFKIKCPNCESKGRWNPSPEGLTLQNKDAKSNDVTV